MFEGFQLSMIDTGEVVIRVRHGGHGPGLLLFHGHPQTNVMWHRIAPRLASQNTLPLSLPICADTERAASHRPHPIMSPIQNERWLAIKSRSCGNWALNSSVSLDMITVATVPTDLILSPSGESGRRMCSFKVSTQVIT